ncbi:hypothetical protein AN958_10795 [Leucoagaricus sp. SymC.cos]|nr:hypothetical protein AN958_10795 [Leucoagaricus sp. SymC.cos]
MTCLYAELGASVLFFAHCYRPPAPRVQPRRGQRLYSLILTGFLSSATVLGILSPFVGAIPSLIPPLVFLLYTLCTLPLLAHLVHAHLSKLTKALPKLKTTPIVTVPIPPPLPSPASSSTSFPSSSSQTHKPHKDAKPVEPEQLAAGSSCSTGLYKFASTESGCTTTTDIENTRPASSIKQRAQLIQTRFRTILVTLVISQLFILLSDALLLVIAISNHTSVLRIIETVFLVLAICGFMFAFTLHGTPITPSKPASIPSRVSIPESVAERQDKFDSATTITITGTTNVKPRPEEEELDYAEAPDNSIPDHHHSRITGTGPNNNGNRPWGLGFNFGKFSIFREERREEERGVPLQIFQRHGRFASGSSSFSSPPRNSNRGSPYPIVTSLSPPIPLCEEEKEFQEGKFEDEGIGLPALPTHSNSGLGQLPSPPDTPRARVHPQSPTTATTIMIFMKAYVVMLLMSLFPNDRVRIGIISPPEKVNVIRELDEPFHNFQQHHDIHEGVYGDVVDVAVSEPGCCRPISEIDEEDEEGDRETKDPTSQSKVVFSPLDPGPILTPRSPTFPSFSNRWSSTTKQGRMKPRSRSTMSLSLSFRGSSNSLSSPSSPSSTQSPTSPLSPSSRLGLGLQWRRAEKIRERLKRHLTAVNHQGVHPHPSSSSIGETEPNHNSEFDVGRRTPTWSSPTTPTTTANYTLRKLSSLSPLVIPGSRTPRGGGEIVETADFLDLTDPFASPTPGFALPKCIGNGGGSTSDIGHGTSVGDMNYDESQNPSRGWKGKGRDVGDGDVMIEDGHGGAYGGGSGMMKTRVSEWGRLPVIVTSPPLPPLPPPSATLMQVSEKEKERRRGRSERKKRRPRPDSPMPMTMTMGTKARSLGSRTTMDEEEGGGDGERVVERPGSPVPPSPSPIFVSFGEETERSVFSSEVTGLGRIHTTTKSDGKTTKARTRRRNGSPVPIPFRSSSMRRVKPIPNTSASGRERNLRETVEEEEGQEESGSIGGGLNLEEVLLAQRLLRRLDSAFGDSRRGGVNE